MSAKTRTATTCKLIGPPAKLPASELPTLNQVLQNCLFVKLNSLDHRPENTYIAAEVTGALTEIWKSVNPSIPLISNVYRKVFDTYTNYLTVINPKAKGSKKKETALKPHLEKLFDICSCKCPFTGHQDTCLDNCQILHINCSCGRHFKVPVEELPFLKDQREKVGSCGHYQMGSVDFKHERKRKSRAARHGRNAASKYVKTTLSDAPEIDCVPPFRVSSTSSDDYKDDAFEPPKSAFYARSDTILEDLPNLAREADRYKLSDRAVAAVTTAALIDRGIITGISSVISRSSVRNARKKYRKTVSILGNDPITAVYFDGKKDDTCTKEVDEDGVMRYSKVKEEHYVLTSEPDGIYMSHVTPMKGDAQTICDNVCGVLQEMDADKNIKVLGSDSTNTMSGAEGGAQHFIEIFFKQNFFRVFCNLHTNETPMRNLFIHLDGKTTGKDSFSGPIGKKLKLIESLEVKKSFPAVITGDAPPILQDEVFHDLSWDQKCQYKLLQAVRSGKCNSDVANMKIGPLNHSRWLTLACRILFLYMCYHGLADEVERKLNIMVHYIMTTYGPMWFHIKMKPLITDAPKHVFQQTKLLQLLPEEVVKVVKPYVARNAYYAHPENLLISMLDDDDEAVRKKAVTIIMNIRRKDSTPPRPIRLFRVPKLLFDADCYHEMINWEKEKLTEPPLTYSLSDDEVKSLELEPLHVPPYPAHTQSVERAITLVTGASSRVYGFESRHGMCKATVASRQLHNKCESKADLVKML